MARTARRLGNFPAEASSFVGRRRELAEVRKKLAQARLVSLTGPGGVGKTRLAIRVAADLGRGFRDGGSLVELAEVLDPDAVDYAVMAALDLRDQAAAEPLPLLLAHLQDKEMLLVVDNCEHLLGAAGLLDEAHLTATGIAYPARVGVAQAWALNGFFEDDLGAIRSGASEGVRLAREAGDLYGLEISSRAQIAAWTASPDR